LSLYSQVTVGNFNSTSAIYTNPNHIRQTARLRLSIEKSRVASALPIPVGDGAVVSAPRVAGPVLVVGDEGPVAAVILRSELSDCTEEAGLESSKEWGLR
jgi:hypothetical protein